jgi:hypothetical protein
MDRQGNEADGQAHAEGPGYTPAAKPPKTGVSDPRPE